MVNFSRRWNGDNGDNGMAIVFEKFYNHHQWFLVGSTIGYDGFSMVFPILRTNGSQWLQTEICNKLRVNKDVKKLKCELSIYFSQMFYIFSQSHIFFTRTCAVSICLLAPPSGALAVSQFQDPVQSVTHIALVVLICSKLCLNAPDWIWQSLEGQ